MAAERLARFVCPPDRLASLIETAALRRGDPDVHDVMFVRILPDRVETPASNPGASQSAYCTANATRYDDLELFVDPPVDLLFDLDVALSWLRWLEGGWGSVTATFEGDPDTGVVDRALYRTDGTEVAFDLDTDWSHEEISLTLPERFDGGQFLDAAGDPMPTTIRLDVAELERLLDAADLVGESDEYDVVVADGSLQFVADRPDVSISSTFDADVTGPDCRTTVASDLRRVADSLEGTVQLQTGPGEPVAVVKDRTDFTLRFVVFPP